LCLPALPVLRQNDSAGLAVQAGEDRSAMRVIVECRHRWRLRVFSDTHFANANDIEIICNKPRNKEKLHLDNLIESGIIITF
jgi:hypothetical protein